MLHKTTKACLCAALILMGLEPLWADAVDYDIVYVRAPRVNDTQLMSIPEVFDPIKLEAGTDLVLLHPDGSEEILVDCDTADDDNNNEKCAVLDPSLSFDAKWVYYSKVADQASTNPQRRDAAYSGADIFKMNLASRQITQLTFQEWTPNTGARAWSSDPMSSEPDKPNYIKYGIYNLGPSPLPGGKLVFTSSRNGYAPNKSYTFPNLQLFVMDDNGENVELIGHLNLGSALHPGVLTDGRVMFSSFESQGLRDSRIWGLWHINPDGSEWGPLMSAFDPVTALHWQTQMSDGSIVITEYYNLNNSGFGTLFRFPADIPAGEIKFGSPNPSENPALQGGLHSNGNPYLKRISFSPYGIDTLTPFTHGRDDPSSAGKVTQPSGAPGNDLLIVYSPGPANHKGGQGYPRYDAGIYLLSDGIQADSEYDLVAIKNDPAWNEQQPKPVVSYSAIYGVTEPTSLPWNLNDGTKNAALPAGTPYGLVGTSSLYRRNTTPGTGDTGFDGLDSFNSFGNDGQISSNWFTQGADAGKYTNADIYAVRILAMEPTSAQAYGPGGYQPDWKNHANERLRILGEIPLRKFDSSEAPILDASNNPDTSFLSKIPADTPFTFQTIDKNGMVLNMSQTWHQLRPGEVRHNCGGCHAHAQQPMAFAGTAASKPGYVIADLANTTPLLSKDEAGDTTLTVVAARSVDVEFHRDIKPILERSCISCHTAGYAGGPPAGLILDDDSLIDDYDGTWHRLANDRDGDYGIPPLTVPYGWRQTNRSRYVRAFQSRRSLLMWKIMGARLDGWSNSDHPSPSTRGDKTTLPNGDSNNEVNQSDIDFDGEICPPPGTAQALTDDEKMLFARWIDLGAPISKPGTSGLSWFSDELRPTLAISQPRAGGNEEALKTIRLGLFDYYSGLDQSTLSVKASFDVNGRPADTELGDLFVLTEDHIWQLQLDQPLDQLDKGQIDISIKDNAGNLVEMKRSFSVKAELVDELIMFPVKSADGKLIIIWL